MTWISVKDSLPKKMEKVLFFWILEKNIKNIGMGFLSNEGWNIYLPYSSYGLRKDICPVSHWMELPVYPSQFVYPNDDPIYIINSCEYIKQITETKESLNKQVKEFALRFIENNKDLLKRLSEK